MKLENWSTIDYGRGARLVGLVYGNPAFVDGMLITTSRIVSAEQGRYVVTQTGSYYELGAQDQTFKMSNPNARAELLQTPVNDLGTCVLHPVKKD